MSIKHYLNKIKDKLDIDIELILCLLILIIVAVASFGLGRLSQYKTNLEENDDIAISYIDKQEIGNTKSRRYVSSKNGKLYYPINCGASNRILLENRIYFSTRNEAIKSGYKLSSSCK